MHTSSKNETKVPSSERHLVNLESLMETDGRHAPNETSNSADSSILEIYSKLGKVIYRDRAGQVFPRNPTSAVQPLFVVHLQHIL